MIENEYKLWADDDTADDKSDDAESTDDKEESSDEERSEFYNKLGRPEAPDKYELQID